ncbi:hypothetical protein MY11210_003881 [Beauveria gryllotalpidicola]
MPQTTEWATKLNIVIQVVGSRGDVQPFVALGTELQRCGRSDTWHTGSSHVYHALEQHPKLPTCQQVGRSIDREDVAMFDGPMLAESLNIPFTYCWLPALVPKPADWPSHIDVRGFFFRDAPKFPPPADLVQFFDSGPAPIYIGFGSNVLDDPARVLSTIPDAVRATRVRAIISKGWSDMPRSDLPDIY